MNIVLRQNALLVGLFLISSTLLILGSIIYWSLPVLYQKTVLQQQLPTSDYSKIEPTLPLDVSELNKKTLVFQPSYKIPIIMYHYVEYVKDEKDTIRRSLTIAPHVFESQLATLVNGGYTTYTVSDIPNILNGIIPYTPKSIVLTFDDGYADFYTDAYPLLQKYNVKATVYVVINFIGREGFLTGAQIQELAKSPLIEIGSHTLNHTYLKGGRSDIVKMEIAESKKVLEDLTGTTIKTFAYPYGAFDIQAVAEAQEASYSAAVSVITGDQQSLINEYYLSRIRAGSLGSGDYMMHFLSTYGLTPTPLPQKDE